MILRRLKDSRFSEIVPEWQGDAAVVIGGGPSLTLEQIELVREAHQAKQVRCIAINDAYLWAPWADLLYAADADWHDKQRRGIAKPVLGLTADDVRRKYESFAGLICSVENGDHWFSDRVHVLNSRDFPIRWAGTMPTSMDLVAGRSSLHQGMNIGILAGVVTVLLLGCDGQVPAKGMTHFHGGHERPISPEFWQEMQKSFSAAENVLVSRGVKVINCTPGSVINNFERMELAEALCLQPDPA